MTLPTCMAAASFRRTTTNKSFSEYPRRIRRCQTDGRRRLGQSRGRQGFKFRQRSFVLTRGSQYWWRLAPAGERDGETAADEATSWACSMGAMGLEARALGFIGTEGN
jgi:hypothetical protein